MLAPMVILALFPPPVIGVDPELKIGTIVIVPLDVPAITIVIADNARGSPRAGHRQGTNPHRTGEYHRAELLHLRSPLVSDCTENVRSKWEFRRIRGLGSLRKIRRTCWHFTGLRDGGGLSPPIDSCADRS